MKSITTLCLLLGLCLLVLAHDFEPLETVNVKDANAQDSPMKVWGTCDAYAYEHDAGFMAVGVEENNVSWQNVSDKAIKYMLVELSKTDVRGKLSRNYHQFFRHPFPAGYSNRLLEPQTYPSGRQHVFSISHRIPVKEYQLGERVPPTCATRAVYVQFADDTSWRDKQYSYYSIPEQIQDTVREHGG